MSCRKILAVTSLGLLAGCNTVYEQSLSADPGFGEAVKYDMAVQTIDPDPVYAEDGAQPGDHGDKGAQSVKRYRTDAVKDVETMGTSSRGGGAGSSGGGGPN